MSRFKFFEEAESRQINSEKDSLSYNAEPGTFEYELVQEQLTKANDQIISDTQTVMTWQQEHGNIGSQYHQVNLNLTSHEVVRTNQLFKQLSDFAKLFNAPVARLAFKLDKIGNVAEIINQQEIFSIWSDIKSKELLSMVNARTSESETVVRVGDKEFSNSLELVRNGIIYQLMLPCVYENVVPSLKVINQQFYPSNIFNEKKVELAGKRTFEMLNENMIIVEETFADNPYGKHVSLLQEIYNTQFKSVLNVNMEYSYKIKKTYHFLKMTGLIEYGNCTIEEKLNEKFVFSSNYELKLRR